MFEVRQIDAKTWVRDFEGAAHKAVFGKIVDPEKMRIDFALLVTRGNDLHGYLTGREFEAGTLYLQYGGAFPGTKETSVSLPAYLALVEWCTKNYPRVTTLVENDNFVYLKFAMKAGFKIIGIRTYGTLVLLEHFLGEPA